MNKPILKVHVGLHKTGTTYIQSLLKKQRKALLDSGILYPLAGLHGSGHSALAVNYIEEEVITTLRRSNILSQQQPALNTRDNILYELNLMERENTMVIISAEGLALANQGGVKLFAEHYLPYFEIQIIVFLRRQDFMAESSRAQAYKVNLAGYNPVWPFHPDNQAFNYNYVLNYWSGQFGDESITVVEYPEKRGSQALSNLTASIFGLPTSLEMDDQPINERLGREVLEYIFNHSTLVYGTRSYFEAIRRLSRYSIENPPAARYWYFYSPQERQEILDTYRESNELISNKYVKDLFTSCPPIDFDEEWEPYPGLTDRQIVTFDKLLADIDHED